MNLRHTVDKPKHLCDLKLGDVFQIEDGIDDNHYMCVEDCSVKTAEKQCVLTLETNFVEYCNKSVCIAIYPKAILLINGEE